MVAIFLLYVIPERTPRFPKSRSSTFHLPEAHHRIDVLFIIGYDYNRASCGVLGG
jgi:hypothetical protein